MKIPSAARFFILFSITIVYSKASFGATELSISKLTEYVDNSDPLFYGWKKKVWTIFSSFELPPEDFPSASSNEFFNNPQWLNAFIKYISDNGETTINKKQIYNIEKYIEIHCIKYIKKTLHVMIHEPPYLLVGGYLRDNSVSSSFPSAITNIIVSYSFDCHLGILPEVSQEVVVHYFHGKFIDSKKGKKKKNDESLELIRIDVPLSHFKVVLSNKQAFLSDNENCEFLESDTIKSDVFHGIVCNILRNNKNDPIRCKTNSGPLGVSEIAVEQNETKFYYPKVMHYIVKERRKWMKSKNKDKDKDKVLFPVHIFRMG